MPDLTVGNTLYEIHQSTIEACVDALDNWLEAMPEDGWNLTRENLEAPVLAVLLAALVAEKRRAEDLARQQAVNDLLNAVRNGPTSQLNRLGWPPAQPIQQEFGPAPTGHIGYDATFPPADPDGPHLHYEVLPDDSTPQYLRDHPNYRDPE
jgi:hypothetical protein